MSNNEKRLIPQLDLFLNLNEVELTEMEREVLSQVDGWASAEELAKRYKIPLAKEIAILKKLSGMGVINFLRKEDMIDTTAEIYQGVVLSPYALSEKVELSRKEKKRILALYQRMDNMDYYEMLGLGKEVEQTEIAQAYIEISSRYIPADWRSKKLGTFHHKLDSIVKFIEQAYFTLRDPELRAAYDRRNESGTDESSVMNAGDTD